MFSASRDQISFASRTYMPAHRAKSASVAGPKALRYLTSSSLSASTEGISFQSGIHLSARTKVDSFPRFGPEHMTSRAAITWRRKPTGKDAPPTLIHGTALRFPQPPPALDFSLYPWDLLNVWASSVRVRG